MNVRELIAGALEPWGINLAATATAEQYDLRAPEGLRALELLAGARGLVVVASAGGAFWDAFTRACREDAELRSSPHPMDTFAARALDRADAALREAGVHFRRFEPTFYADVILNFVAMGEVVGLGRRGPFGMLIHPVHGPWFGLRGAYFVDADVPPSAPAASVCTGCSEPCIRGATRTGTGLSLASFEVRGRCIVGGASRYSEAQMAFHEAAHAKHCGPSARA